VTQGAYVEVAQPGASALAFLAQTTPSQMNLYLPLITR
jgi:hypothetical protein